MNKKLIFVALIVVMLVAFININKVCAATEQVISNDAESKLVEIKETQLKTIEDYKQKYGSDAYGITAYVLNIIRIYSIPFCFLGIAISAIHQYVIGIRKLDTQEKGLVSMVTFVTLLIICQILPLAFAIVVKFGRG